MAGKLCNCDRWMRVQMLEGEREEKESVLNWTFYQDSADLPPRTGFPGLWVPLVLCLGVLDNKHQAPRPPPPQTSSVPYLPISPLVSDALDSRRAGETESRTAEGRHFCLRDCEEKMLKKSCRNCEMEAGEWGQRTRQENSQPGLRSASFTLPPVYGEKHVS